MAADSSSVRSGLRLSSDSMNRVSSSAVYGSSSRRPRYSRTSSIFRSSSCTALSELPRSSSTCPSRVWIASS